MGKVLHASRSGYFPFCIKERTTENVGAGTRYPIGLSLEDAMRAYWIINALAIEIPTVSYATPINFHIGEASIFDFDAAQQVYLREKFSVEEDHVCYPRPVTEASYEALGTTWFYCSSFDYAFSSPYIYAVDFGLSFGPQEPTKAAILKDGNLYYHYITAGLSVLLAEKPEGDPFEFNAFVTTLIEGATPGYYVLSTGVFDFFGLGTASLYRPTTSDDASLSVVAKSYWPYDQT
jgi:hypothetical protein